MKNASKQAATLRSLYKKVAPKHPDERPALDPLRALVLGVLREDADDAVADAAMARLDEEFVDVNELRVATELELADLLGEDYPDAEPRAGRLRELLMALFDGEGHLSLGRVTAMQRKEQRAALRGLPRMTPFVEAHAILLAYGSAAVPLDGRSKHYLCDAGACLAEWDVAETQLFVEDQLKAEECWPFFAGLRRVAFEAKAAKVPAKRKARAAS